jgi:hypothetical protein
MTVSSSLPTSSPTSSEMETLKSSGSHLALMPSSKVCPPPTPPSPSCNAPPIVSTPPALLAFADAQSPAIPPITDTSGSTPTAPEVRPPSASSSNTPPIVANNTQPHSPSPSPFKNPPVVTGGAQPQPLSPSSFHTAPVVSVDDGLHPRPSPLSNAPPVVAGGAQPQPLSPSSFHTAPIVSVDDGIHPRHSPSFNAPSVVAGGAQPQPLSPSSFHTAPIVSVDDGLPPRASSLFNANPDPISHFLTASPFDASPVIASSARPHPQPSSSASGPPIVVHSAHPPMTVFSDMDDVTAEMVRHSARSLDQLFDEICGQEDNAPLAAQVLYKLERIKVCHHFISNIYITNVC